MSSLYNRLILFSARKVKDYQQSGFNIASSIMTILALIGLTVFSFLGINMGIYKINPSFFTVSAKPTFFTFMYYSFNNLLFNSVPDLVPSMPISQAASMLESALALFLIVIFVSLLLSVRSQRYTDELNEVIRILEAQGEELESFIKEEFKLRDIADALVELERAKASFAQFFYTITKNL